MATEWQPTLHALLDWVPLTRRQRRDARQALQTNLTTEEIDECRAKLLTDNERRRALLAMPLTVVVDDAHTRNYDRSFGGAKVIVVVRGVRYAQMQSLSDVFSLISRQPGEHFFVDLTSLLAQLMLCVDPRYVGELVCAVLWNRDVRYALRTKFDALNELGVFELMKKHADAWKRLVDACAFLLYEDPRAMLPIVRYGGTFGVRALRDTLRAKPPKTLDREYVARMMPFTEKMFARVPETDAATRCAIYSWKARVV